MDKIEEVPNIAWKIIRNMAENIETNERFLMFNERYLHHYFSKEVQNNGIDLNICGGNIMMFPEWPTYKKGRKNNFAKYKEESSGYEPKDINVEEGHAGFIDFAIGNYDSPKIGIEFKYLTGWNKEAITFDLLKLIDKRNPFEVAIWFGLILRKNGFSKMLNLEHFNKAFSDAKERLESVKEKENNWKDQVKERTMIILAAEVDNKDNKKYFLCEDENFRIAPDIEDYNGFKL